MHNCENEMNTILSNNIAIKTSFCNYKTKALCQALHAFRYYLGQDTDCLSLKVQMCKKEFETMLTKLRHSLGH